MTSLPRPTRRRLSAIALGAVLGALPSAAERPDPRAENIGPTERLQRLIERVKLEQEELETLSAGFAQHKQSALLVEPETSRGAFYYQAPDRVRWDFDEPAPMQIVIRDDAMVTWYEDLSVADVIKVGEYSDQVFKYLGASNSLEVLQRYFTVNAAFPEDHSLPYRLELEPRFDRVERRVAAMTIWIDPGLFLPTALEYHEPDGDVTRYEFESLRVNEPLPERAFELELPEGVDVRTIDLGRTSDR